MKVIDEKGKLFGVINVIDFFIVVVLLVLAGGIYYKVTVSNAVVDTTPIHLTLWQEHLRQPTIDAIRIGDNAYDLESNGYLGKIVDKKVVPAVDDVETADGRVVTAEIPGKYNVTFTIEGEGIYTDRGIVIGGVDWHVGNTLIVKSQLMALKTIVVGIDEIKSGTKE